MPSSAGLEFSKIFNFDGSSTYTDITQEMQSPLGTATTVLNTANHYLYLGDTEKFDMAVFDLTTSGNLGELTWQFSNGTNWTTFTPSSGGRLMASVSRDTVGVKNYLTKRDFRRVLDREQRREGYDYFAPKDILFTKQYSQ